MLQKLLVVFMFSAVSAGLVHAGQVIYVDAAATAGGDGASWSGAYQFLQDALAEADPCDDIWVAEGIYQPDRYAAAPGGTGSRWTSFWLIDKVGLYGGFPSGGGTWQQRDPNTYEPLLSGDLACNDVEVSDPCDLPGEPSRAENSYHVIICNGGDDKRILDGFTISGGNADGVFPDNVGGGMYNSNTNLIITGCVFRGNTAIYGGAMRNLLGSPTLSYCMFDGNACEKSAGGMYNYDSNPTISNCSFSNNWGLYAGGMYNYSQSNPSLIECTFSGNVAGADGGAMNNYFRSDPNIIGCQFSDNTAGRDGGAVCGGGVGKFSDCDFNDNMADRHGGGMFVDKNSTPTLSNCDFTGNSSVENGGGINSDSGSDPNLCGCTFSGNTAGQDGGAVCCVGKSRLSDCDFNDNTAERHGGGMNNDPCSVPNIRGCTFSDNTAGQDGGGMCNNNCNSTATENTFINNTSQRGGGIYNYFSTTVISCSGFSGNNSVDGGGIYNDGGNFQVINCTLTGNTADNGDALACYMSSGDPNDPNELCVTNCIIWNGSEQILKDDNVVLTITYSDLQGGWSGLGNIDTDPCFADISSPDPGQWDCHLKSQAGRWDSLSQSWVYDTVTSLCIDASNPGSPLENEPNDVENVRVNMGMYGRTFQASKSPDGWRLLADINNDWSVNQIDMVIQLEDWLGYSTEQPGDLNRDAAVNIKDTALLSKEWLKD